MNEILRFMQKRDEQMDRRTHVRKAFYNLPTTAFGCRREIIKCLTAAIKTIKHGSMLGTLLTLCNMSCCFYPLHVHVHKAVHGHWWHPSFPLEVSSDWFVCGDYNIYERKSLKTVTGNKNCTYFYM